MRKKLLYSSLIILFIFLICAISAFNLRVNRYGLPPFKSPRSELIQRGDYSYLREYISELIKKRMQQNNVAGLSIALVDHYKLVWAEGFGFQNKEDNISATDRSIYNLASVTKLITATAIMQLVEQGLIDLDQPIREYIPEFQIRSRFTNTQRDTLEEMLTVQNDDIPLDIGFKLCLGWYLDRVCLRYAGRYCGHGGDFAAVHTHMGFLPGYKLGVIVAANTDTAAVIVREIADLALQLALEIKTGLKPPDENHESVKLSKNQYLSKLANHV